LSRNGSGIYQLPGSSFPANPSTLIESAKYNNNLNDIAAAITQSIASDGQTPITANIPFGGNKLTGLGAGTLAGESVRFNQLQQGSDIAVADSGVVTIPNEGSLFNLTAASAFNVTGFSSNYNGRTFGVRFNPDKLLKLVNSSTFKLIGGTDRMPAAGEIAYFQQESGGSITEVGFQPLLDLTSYSGADIPLAIGQRAVYDVSAVTSVLLRLATGNNQLYVIRVNPNTPVGADTGVAVILSPNNTTFTSGQARRSQLQVIDSTVTGAIVQTDTVFVLCSTTTPSFIRAEACTRTNGKHVFVNWRGVGSAGGNQLGTYSTFWNDTTTAWSSLGTITFAAATTGRIEVQREY
jgi:hypothetical protein